MTKETQTQASVDSVMAKAMMLVGALDDSCEEATSLPFLEAVTALRAEAERLAAQAAPTTADRWNDAALPPEIEQRLAPWLTNGAALHPATVNLVVRFARALSKKLAAAETKYGYSDGWLSPDWMDECRAKLMEHIAKGDPRDVAAYCAFLWHHGASTVTSQPSQAPVVQAVQAREYPPLPWGNQQPYVWFCRTKDTDLVAAFRAYVDADRASSGATTQAVRMLTKEEPEKCYSLDEETFHDLGDFIDMLDEEQAQPGFLVYEGESDMHTASHYARGAVSDLFERMGEQAFEDAGEHIGDWPDNTVKGDKLAELERLINDWLDANVKVHFYTVKNVRQIALTPEMLSDDDAGRTIPPSGEIGGA